MIIKRFVQLLAVVGAAAGLAIAVPAASADPPTFASGLYLTGYCQSLGYYDVTLIKGSNYGPNYAYDNWRCITADGATHPFSMEQACRWMNPTLQAVLAYPSDPNDAFTWNCYAPGNHAG